MTVRLLWISYLQESKHVDMAMQLWWRAAALESLKAYIQNILLTKRVLNWKQQLEDIVRMISPVTEALSEVPTLLDPVQAPGGPGGWIAATAGYLQLRLLDIYSLIPLNISFLGDHEALVRICSKPIRGSTTLCSTPGTVVC